MDSQTAPSWQDRLAALDAADRKEEALAFLREQAFLRPDDAECAFTLATRSAACGMLDEAIAVFTLVAHMGSPRYRFRALVDGAECLRKCSEFARAEADLTAAMAFDPGSHWPVIGMAELYSSDGRDGDRLAFLAERYPHLRSDGKAEVLRYAAGMQAYWHFGATRHADSWRPPHCPGEIPVLHRAGMILMVKDEEDIIGQNLRHHYAIGFRCFCLLDNNSTDGTRAQIEAFRTNFPEALVLYVHDPVVGYYQADKMAIFQDALIRYAQLADITLDWMFFVDADEFIAFTGANDATGRAGFRALLEDDALSLIVMHWLNAAPRKMLDSIPPDADPFIAMQKVNSQLLPVVPKVALRVGCGFVPMMGNHFVDHYEFGFDSCGILALRDWYMLHYPLRSLTHVRSKVINGGLAYRNAKGLESDGGHWRERYSLYEKHGDKVLQQMLQNHIDAMQDINAFKDSEANIVYK